MVFKFTAPGSLTEMNADAAADWHTEVNGYFKGSRNPPETTFAGSRNQFFNPADGIEADAVEKEIGWTAFPRPLTISSATDDERWNLAEESRFEQVEYCEWSTTRDANGKVLKITFTCEDRNYFCALFRRQPEVVLALYREHVSPDVQMSDLVDGLGNYKPVNRWNANSSDGAMHMIGGPNTIGAAVELVAGACVVRSNPDGTLKTGARELIICGNYGARERHSDPTIGAEVNKLARAGHFVALANPPQLAFESISFAGWDVPDGVAPEDCWTYTRGSGGRAVRGVLEAPEGASFVVGDIEINGKAIRFGGQVADGIRIKVTGLAHMLGQATIEAEIGCIGDPVVSGTGGATPAPAPEGRPLNRFRRI
ncbi:hypothetical protein NMQ14_17640 [Methyloversatilis sp. XJ19-13]|uniref:hypothetical protein n=1 Tax=Methyloversatilis sp. XJ19-13 TaxID=2963430 RepID=UPI00211D0D27|nr:hypothetical protein [Methyloversatilis sp. XJ19-13]MCQ9376074.1 hypothetical protein [Methyloversatilis sp. XJ19-13]